MAKVNSRNTVRDFPVAKCKIRPVSRIDLTNHFLIAMPSMADPNFARTLTFVLEHNDKGAMGVVINRPVELTVSDLFERVEIQLGDRELGRQAIYYGGPVQQDHGFVLHRPIGAWKSTLPVANKVGLTTSKDILEAVAAGCGPDEMLVALGYAGWGADQLEAELKQNAWLTVEADDRIIFEVPVEQRLDAAMALLGIDFARLHGAAGHA